MVIVYVLGVGLLIAVALTAAYWLMAQSARGMRLRFPWLVAAAAWPLASLAVFVVLYATWES